MPKKKGAAETVVFSGRLTIQTVRAQKERLAADYGRAPELTVVIRDVEAVDLSFFQLLCSLHRTALRDKKRLILEPPVSPLVRQLMAAVGFERAMSCTERGDETCFWKTIAADKT